MRLVTALASLLRRRPAQVPPKPLAERECCATTILSFHAEGCPVRLAVEESARVTFTAHATYPHSDAFTDATYEADADAGVTTQKARAWLLEHWGVTARELAIAPASVQTTLLALARMRLDRG